MKLNIQEEKGIEGAVKYLADSIISNFQKDKKVLLLLSGGSASAVGISAARIISNFPHKNLTVTLMDERYGKIGHPDSNWQTLLNGGFSLPEAKLVPVLFGESLEETVNRFNDFLKKELNSVDYAIGLFGIGEDGHTAGILPNSKAVEADSYAFGYSSGKFTRVTITFPAIAKLDEAVAYVGGERKRKAVADMEKELPLTIEPAQILKKIKKLTVFTNFK